MCCLGLSVSSPKAVQIKDYIAATSHDENLVFVVCLIPLYAFSYEWVVHELTCGILLLRLVQWLMEKLMLNMLMILYQVRLGQLCVLRRANLCL